MEHFKISWQALEYEDRERTPDWYWAVGIISISAIVASVLFGNYLFAGLILIASVLMIIFSTRKPQIVECEANKENVRFGNSVYKTDSLDGFCIDRNERLLILRSKKLLSPLIYLPLGNAPMENLHRFLSAHLKEVRLIMPFSKKFLDLLGF